MQKILKEYMSQDDPELLFYMADIKGERTGLPVTILVSHKIESYGPRINVFNDYTTKPNGNNIFSLSISDKPKIVSGSRAKLRVDDYNKIVNFIKINKDVLLEFWNNYEEDVFDLIPKLKKV